MKDELIKIIEPYVPDKELLNNLTEETTLIEDLQINSANVIDIVLDIEEKYDIIIDDDSISKMETIGSALKIIDEKIEE
jgi:acyl carrier protein